MPVINGNGNIKGNGRLRNYANSNVWFWGQNLNGQSGNGSSSSSYLTSTQITNNSNGFKYGSIQAISIGRVSGFALDTEGTVWFWGNNIYGHLGDGNSGNLYLTLRKMSNGSNGFINGTIQAISISQAECLALDTSGNVWFWGNNINGQLGNGSSSNTSLTPTKIPNGANGFTNGNIKAIYNSEVGCLALDTTNNVWFWGLNTYGQLGGGNNTGGYLTPTKIPNSGSFTNGNIQTISISYFGCLALDTTKTVWFWGWNNYGQLGGGSSSNTYLTPTQIPNGGNGFTNGTIKAISIGQVGCLALDASGIVWFWGQNSRGQLGSGSSSASFLTPTQIPNSSSFINSNIQAIFIAEYGCLALDKIGTVWFWGNNTTGQTGDGTASSTSYLTPTKIPIGSNGFTNSDIQAISISYYGCLAIQNSQTKTITNTSNGVYFWGNNTSGQLGDATASTTSYLTTTKIPNGWNGFVNGTITAISIGQYGCLALDTTTNVWFWGNNQSGQLGSGTASASYLTPTKIPNGANGFVNGTITAISISSSGCLVLDTTQNVWFWGDNFYGQLGDGTGGTSIYLTPTKIPNGANGFVNGTITTISINGYACLALDTTNNVWFWGYNNNGQLGNGTGSASYLTPTKIPNGANGFVNGTITAISTVYLGCLALDTSKNVWFWGNNYRGQLGNGTGGTISYLTPTKIPNGANGFVNGTITAISIDYFGCLALDTSKNVWFWGNNNRGQLGNGTGGTTSYLTPTKIPNGANGFVNGTITAISNGYYGCLALDTTNNVWFWGNNFYGQLGDGTGGTNSYLTPTKILNGSNGFVNGTITAISNGYYGCLAIQKSQPIKSIYFWGQNSYGQLGNGNINTTKAPSTLNYYMKPSQIIQFSNVTAISSIVWECLALDANKNVWFWGYNNYGQLGNGNTNTVTAPSTLNYYMLPTLISGLSNITAISIGAYGCLALDTTKNVYFWGLNQFGQLGNGNPNTTGGPPTVNYYITPTQITGLSNISAIYLYSIQCLALNTSGNVWFWGRNLYGQLGNGNPNTISTPPTYNYNMAPTQITGLSNITAISTSDYGCLALNTSGNVWFWGLNQYGQDGSGNTNTATAPSNLNYYMTPNQIPGLTNITAISMFIAGCLALDTTGNVWFWGYNSNGQLGNGNTNTVTAPSNINYYITPTIVSGLPAITAISIHNSGCLALDTTGNVWFWGKNDKGQLGNINPNSATTSFTYYNCYMTPTQITGLSNITSISINTYGCLAL